MAILTRIAAYNKEVTNVTDGQGAAGQDDGIVELVAECLARIDESKEPPSDVIDAFCGEHPSVAEALRARLVHLERAGLATSRSPAIGDNRTLGRFKILGELGRGGMGVVYLAEDPSLGRRVALKALGPRLVISDRARARFEREVRAIAGLHHPRIVPVYEVGEESGVPWYTMELIEGRTLAQVIQTLKELHLRTDELSTSHLNQATFFDNGDTDSRFMSESDSSTELEAVTPPHDVPALPAEWGKTFVETVCRMVHDVADALEHAHSNGVVHRDVKPSNILIDSRGRALLFDFGLARTETDDALTQTGDFAGTPYYVAPEQVSGNKRGVDHRADVYALGVTLFELLTLQRPFQGRNTQAVFRQILSKDPPLPRKLNKLIPRDLETICITALEKDPNRRYQSATELAADLRRFLEFRPVRARPIGWTTRTIRWGRRHPGAATAAVLSALIAIGVPSAVFATGVFLAREADRTARQAEKASRINQFLLEMLGSAHPAELGFDATIREAIDLAVERAGTDLGEPEVEAGVRATIGNTYVAIGDYEDAEPQLRRALELRLAELDTDHADVAVSQDALGICLLQMGELDEAEERFQEALRIHRKDGEVNEVGLAGCLAHQALLFAERADYDRARGLLAECLDLRRKLFGENSPEVAEGLLDLGAVLEKQSRGTSSDAAGPIEEAERTYRGALMLLAQARGVDHPDTAACRNRLADLLLRELDPEEAERKLDLEEAEQLFEENERGFINRLGDRHPLVARTRASLALTMHLAGNDTDAEGAAREALDMQVDLLPAGHPDIANSEVVLAQILLKKNFPEDASRLLEDAVNIRRKRYGPDAEQTADALHRLSKSYFDQVRFEEAIGVGAEALSVYLNLADPDREAVGGLQHVVGRAWAGMGRPDLALEHLESATGIYAELRGFDSPSTVLYRTDLAWLYFSAKRWEEAGEHYELVIEARRSSGVFEHRETAVSISNLSETLARRGRFSEALDVAHDAVELETSLNRGPSISLATGFLRIGRLLFEAERYEEAVGPLRRGVEMALQIEAGNLRYVFDSARLYGRALIELNDHDEAEARLRETFSVQEKFLGIQHADVLRTLDELAILYERSNEPEWSSWVEGMRSLSFKLRDAGLRPVFGSPTDEGFDYADYD